MAFIAFVYEYLTLNKSKKGRNSMYRIENSTKNMRSLSYKELRVGFMDTYY